MRYVFALVLAAAVPLLVGCSAATLGAEEDCVAPPDGLVSWWPGDPEARDVAGPNGGVPEGGVEIVPGWVTAGEGRAFRFDGVDALVRVPHAPELDPTVTSAFTVHAWARSATLDRNGTVVGKGEPLAESFVIDQIGGRWRGVARNSFGAAHRLLGPPVQRDAFTHLALTWDGTTVRFYVSGVEVEQARLEGIVGSEAFVGIGGRSEAGHRDAALELEFTGTVDEVAYFGRALSAQEVAAVHAAGRAGMCRS